MKRKGIILAGGSGSRLYPTTKVISKQLLPVYDKPMIYYPISLFMMIDIRDLLIITTPHDSSLFKNLLADGNQWGLNIEYAIQAKPDGIAQSLILAEKFLDGSPSMLALGDNIFFGHSLSAKLMSANENKIGATIFSYRVRNPERYGVVNLDANGNILDIEEKPENPRSNLAVTGLYFYDSNASAYAQKIKPSSRGELEITDLNNIYLEKKQLRLEDMNRGYAWLDTGTHETLIEANQFIRTIEYRQGLKIACLEEIAYRKHWIDKAELNAFAQSIYNSSYGQYLMRIVEAE